MSPWLIATTGWPGVALALVVRVVTAPATVALVAAACAALFSLVMIRLTARGRPNRRSTS